jgi:hypothetical protein
MLALNTKASEQKSVLTEIMWLGFAPPAAHQHFSCFRMDARVHAHPFHENAMDAPPSIGFNQGTMPQVNRLVRKQLSHRKR